MESHRAYLDIAMSEASMAFDHNTYPVGAVIVGPHGEIISRGHNHVYDEGDFTSHAETEVIRAGGGKLMEKEIYELCTLYTTLEPCLMCCGAILHARIARVIWVKDDDLHGALRRLRYMPHPLNSLYVSKFGNVRILNAQDILPAHEYDDLARRMDDWTEDWEGMKEEVLSIWRQEVAHAKEVLSQSYKINCGVTHWSPFC